MSRDTTYDFFAGEILLIDKPKHWTSFDVVNKIRYTLKHHFGRKIKVGHGGTLDPLATGLVVIATGKATKQLMSITGADKSYKAVIGLGATTPSYDLETPLTAGPSPDHLTVAMLEEGMGALRGDILQRPPLFSAIKKAGKPLYKAARKGEAVEVEPRPVTIHQFQLDKWEAPYLYATIHCSKGTYIRSLAHDLGQALGVGGYLHDLQRTASGHFQLSDAKTIDNWVALIEQQPVP